MNKKPDFRSYCLHFFKRNNGTIISKDGCKYIEGGIGKIIAYIISIILILIEAFFTDRSTLMHVFLILSIVLILGPIKYFFTKFEKIEVENKEWKE